MKKVLTALLAGITTTALVSGEAPAQALDCPAVEMIVGFGAGGGTDLFARSIAPKLEEELGLPVQVINITAGSGAAAFREVMGRPADGCTFFAITTDYVLLEVTDAADLSLLDLAPLVRAHVDVGLLNASASGGATTWKDMMARAQSEDRSLLIGGVGAASFDEGAVKILMDKASAGYRFIPYDSSKEMHADLLGGRLDLVYDEVGVMLPMVQAGQIVPLALAFPQRVASLPDVPTAAEVGIDASPPIWRGVAVHKDTPEASQKAIVTAVETALSEGPYVEFAKSRSLDLAPGYAGPPDFRAAIEAEIDRFSDAMQQ